MLSFIVNPNSGSGRGADIWKKTKEYLTEYAIPHELYATKYAGEAKEIAEKLTKNPNEKRIIIIIGGDGTLNEVISGLNMENDTNNTKIAYIPAGSGNDFARSMKFSHNPEVTLHKIMENPEYRYIDYGVMQTGDLKCRFCVSTGMGYDAAICRELVHSKIRKFMRKLHLTKLIYIIAGLHQIIIAKPVSGTITLDDEKIIQLDKIWFISSHIHPYEGGGFRLAPTADYSDGKFEMCVIHNIGKIKLAVVMIAALFGGSHRHMKGVDLYSCKKAHLQMSSPMALHTDGEDRDERTEQIITCIEKKLHFIV